MSLGQAVVMESAPSTEFAPPDWIDGRARVYYEIRCGSQNLAVVVILCARCGVELVSEATDVPIASVLADRGVEPTSLEGRLVGSALLRLPSRCECGNGPLPGAYITGRTEVPE